MLRKLKVEYKKWGLTINLAKSEYLKRGKNEGDLHMENWQIKGREAVKCLGVTLTSSGKSEDEINNDIAHG